MMLKEKLHLLVGFRYGNTQQGNDYIENELQIRSLHKIDLSTSDPLSLKDYLHMVYQTHPLLKTDSLFQQNINELIERYLYSIKKYIETDGTWMTDSLIPLFMKKLDVHIFFISKETNKTITHYPTHNSSYCIFMYHANDHFESIGLYSNQIMKRVFESPFPVFD